MMNSPGDPDSRLSMVATSGPTADDDLNVAIQRVQKANETLEREAVQLPVHESRDDRLSRTEHLSGFSLSEVTPTDDLIDPMRQLSLGLQLPSLDKAQVGKDVPATPFDPLYGHGQRLP